MVKPRENLIGKKFGLLTVVNQAEDYIGKNGNHMAAWLCRCDCGSGINKEVPGTWLKQGIVKSCGCLHNKTSINSGKNTYEIMEDYVIGYDMSGNSFLIDLEDLEKIKGYYWSMGVNGYFSKDSRKIQMHRFIMDCNDNNLVVDHINHMKNDNRKNNLRIASRTENNRNVQLSSNNTSGTTGVRWHKVCEKWIANITVNKKLLHLGYYDNFEDAVSARKEAEEKYFGEFSYGNSINKKQKEI